MAWCLRRPLRAHGVALTAALVCACATAAGRPGRFTQSIKVPDHTM